MSNKNNVGENIHAKTNTKVLATTIVSILLVVAVVFLFIWAETVSDSNNEVSLGYKIVVNNEITAYEGDEQLLTPRIVDASGALLPGRFSYAVLGDNAPIAVDENGAVTVVSDSEDISAQIKITELNYNATATVNVTVERKLSGIKGIVFGDDLVVATETQLLTLGDEYAVTVKTIPSHAVLHDEQLSIKTVDKYGKEVDGVLEYSIIPNSNRVNIRTIGLGSGTMVFSITADGVELCKDETYSFRVSMLSEDLDLEITNQLKYAMSNDLGEREKIQLISTDELAKLTSIDISDSVDSLYGLNKTLFPSLETIVFTSANVMNVSDINTDFCYRVKDAILDDYASDALWKDYVYNVIPYKTNAVAEKWLVYHYYTDAYDSRIPGVKAVLWNGENIMLQYFNEVDGYSARGCVNDYFYLGSDDSGKQANTNIQAMILDQLVTNSNGVHIGVGYTPNDYIIKYVVRKADADNLSSDINIEYPSSVTYGQYVTLYTQDDVASEAGVSVVKTGYTISGWLLDPAKPNDVMLGGSLQKNLTDSSSITLYAAWSPIEYTIILEDTDIADMTVKYGQMVTLPIPEKVGYVFREYIDANGKSYSSGLQSENLMSERGSIRLIAKYDVIKYTVIFDRNGGTWTSANAQDSIQLSYGQSYMLYNLNPPQGSDTYEWIQVDTNGNAVNGVTFSAGSTIINLTEHDSDTVRLKALWNPIKYTIEYSFTGFTYSYKDIYGKTQTANGRYTQSRIFNDNASLIEPVRVGYKAYTWKVLYYTEAGSTVQHKPDASIAVMNVGSKENLISGASSEQGRTYYLELTYSANLVTVKFDYQGATSGTTETSRTVYYDQIYGTLPAPKKTGYSFNGWYYGTTLITSTTIVKVTSSPITLIANWKDQSITATVSKTPNDLLDIKDTESVTIKVTGGSGSYTFSPTSGSPSGCNWTFNAKTMILSAKKTADSKSGTIIIYVTDNVYGSTTTISVSWSTSGCIAEGTLITLADGSQKAVEDLTGDEMLLAWDFFTGTFTATPILCIDAGGADIYEVVNLTFSDGTTVKVIGEHGFFDATLGKYVYLDRDNAKEYIGHLFNKQVYVDGAMTYTDVSLVEVTIANEYTTSWSPVTYEYMCIYVNGMLSMPGGIEGLFNIFEVNPDTMQYDSVALEEDLKTYGEFTYEELNELIAIPEELFYAVPCRYLKVAVGKGLITLEGLQDMFDAYKELLFG